MNRTVPLSQFMPYGAPELLAAAPRHLSRAVMASSSMAVAAFFFALLCASLWSPSPPRGVVLERIIDIGRPPAIPLPLPPPLAPPVRPHVQPDQGAVRPVAEPTEPPFEEPAGSHSAVDGETSTRGAPTSEIQAVADDVLPDPGEFVPTDELPVAVTEIRPDYPEIARAAGVEGLVIVRALVGKDGRVLKAVVEDKFSISLLDEAALEAARRWVFTPALMNGKPVAVWVALRFNFRLHER